MTRRKYKPPAFEKIDMRLVDSIMSSDIENFSSYIDDGGDWGDPIIDPDDDIIW